MEIELRNSLNKIILASFALLVIAKADAQSLPQTFSFNGQAFHTDNTPVTNSNVVFKISIYNNDNTCLLFQEQTASFDLSATNGVFALNVGSGTRVSGKDVGLSMNTIFGYGSQIRAPGTNCTSGYTPAAGQGRMLQVAISVDGGSTYEDLNSQLIQSVPFSIQADNAIKVQGKGASDLIQVNAVKNLTQSNAENVFNNYTELMNVILGSSTQYMKTSPTTSLDMNNQRVTNVAAPTTANDAVNKTYADSRIGGSQTDLSGVGSGVGGGKTLIWNATTSKWETGTPAATDASKLPLAGGTLTGPLVMNSSYVHLGNYTNGQEATLTSGLNTAHKGAIWYNTNSNTLKYWNGTAAQSFGTVNSISSVAPLITGGTSSDPSLSLSFGNGLMNSSGVLIAKAGTGITVDSNGINVSNISFSQMPVIGNNKFIGRITTGSGAPEELALGTGLSFTGNTLNVTGGSPTGSAGGSLSGTYPNPTLANSSVNTSQLISGSVTSDRILDNTIDTADIADGTITGNDIANNSISNSKISDVVVNKISSASGQYLTYAPNGTACTVNKVLKVNASGQWICGDDNDTGSTWSINGANIYRNSKVGIGTSAPAEDLSIYNASTSGASVSIAPSGTNTGQSMLNLMTKSNGTSTFGNDGNTAGWQFYANSQSSNGDLGLAYWSGSAWSTNPLLYIKSSNGNVGINTTNPSTKLEVNGSFKAGATTLTGATTINAATSITSGGLSVSAGGVNVASGNITATTGRIIASAGSIVSTAQTLTSAPAAFDLNTSNTFIASGYTGGTGVQWTLNNPANGGSYTIVVLADPTSRTFTIATPGGSSCSSVYYRPAIAPTAANTRSIYGIVTIQNGGNWECYVNWTTGYQ